MSDYVPPPVAGALKGERCEECFTLMPPLGISVVAKPQPCVVCGWSRPEAAE